MTAIRLLAFGQITLALTVGILWHRINTMRLATRILIRLIEEERREH